MFVQDRIVVHVHARAKLGTTVRGVCIGVSLATDADVSMVPDAEQESIGFRDAKIDHLSDPANKSLYHASVESPR